ncbi:hypothetical protein [Aeoliella sp.]|uniref:hypothetical protein n=1 Tax=Aeoliella sp. TaxID=2795800 RepID=UPI003CCC2248
MAIELLTICAWQRGGLDRIEVSNPTWGQVSKSIRELDGQSRNDLYLIPNVANVETWLAVGGGNGRYLVTGSINNDRFPTVVRLPESDGLDEQLLVGGQVGDYPKHWILDLDTAIIAAQSFYQTSEFGGGGLHWIDA